MCYVNKWTYSHSILPSVIIGLTYQCSLPWIRIAPWCTHILCTIKMAEMWVNWKDFTVARGTPDCELANIQEGSSWSNYGTVYTGKKMKYNLYYGPMWIYHQKRKTEFPILYCIYKEICPKQPSIFTPCTYPVKYIPMLLCIFWKNIGTLAFKVADITFLKNQMVDIDTIQLSPRLHSVSVVLWGIASWKIILFPLWQLHRILNYFAIRDFLSL